MDESAPVGGSPGAQCTTTGKEVGSAAPKPVPLGIGASEGGWCSPVPKNGEKNGEQPAPPPASAMSPMKVGDLGTGGQELSATGVLTGIAAATRLVVFGGLSDPTQTPPGPRSQGASPDRPAVPPAPTPHVPSGSTVTPEVIGVLVKVGSRVEVEASMTRNGLKPIGGAVHINVTLP